MPNRKATRRTSPGTSTGRPTTPQPTAAGLFPRPQSTREAEQAQLRAERLQWLAEAQRAAWELIEQGHPFDAHTITERVGRPYPGDGRNLARIIWFHREREHLQHWDFIKSRKPTSHAVVAVWEPTSKGRAAARQVLGYAEDTDAA